MPDDASVITATDVRGHFHEAVHDAVRNQQLDLSEYTSSYLINLLSSFIDSRTLFESCADGTYIKPLAELYGEAASSVSAKERERALRRLGDIALFVAGVFSDCLKRRVVDIDYYVSMGGSAYSYLATVCARETTASGSVFGELSERFVACVDVLAEACESRHVISDRDILRLYEVWMRTGSERSARQLQELGIQVSISASLTQH